MLELLEQIEVAARKASCMGEEFRERGARSVEIMRELERIEGLADRVYMAGWETVARRLRQETENCGCLVTRYTDRAKAAARLDALMHYAWGLCDAAAAEREGVA